MALDGGEGEKVAASSASSSVSSLHSSTAAPPPRRERSKKDLLKNDELQEATRVPPSSDDDTLAHSMISSAHAAAAHATNSRFTDDVPAHTSFADIRRYLASRDVNDPMIGDATLASLRDNLHSNEAEYESLREHLVRKRAKQKMADVEQLALQQKKARDGKLKQTTAIDVSRYNILSVSALIKVTSVVCVSGES
jgi:hypothetical protein